MRPVAAPVSSTISQKRGVSAASPSPVAFGRSVSAFAVIRPARLPAARGRAERAVFARNQPSVRADKSQRGKMTMMHKYAAMDVRRLAIFLEVVDQGGFTRAADVLDVSQPSVSQAVRELETDLGTPLFHRFARSVALTSAGEALVPSARQV